MDLMYNLQVMYFTNFDPIFFLIYNSVPIFAFAINKEMQISSTLE